jgi:G3E family GTPase
VGRGHFAKREEGTTPMPDVAPQIPVTVLTGYLGSRKTTLLNCLLLKVHDKRLAMIASEFEEVSVDNDLFAERIIELEPGFLKEEHEHDNKIGSLSLVADRPMKPNRFFSWILDVTQRYGTDILRMKGIASIEDDDRQFVVQSVHMFIEGGSHRPWKEQEPRQTRLVFIGRDLPKNLLKQGFEACCV